MDGIVPIADYIKAGIIRLLWPSRVNRRPADYRVQQSFGRLLFGIIKWRQLAEPVAFAIPIREISAANSLSTWLSD